MLHAPLPDGAPSQLAHAVLEVAGMALGAWLFWHHRPLAAATPLPAARWDRLAIVAGAALGAALGAHALYMLQYLHWLLAALADATSAALATTGTSTVVTLWLGGKTVVGGLLGGVAGVELAKRAVGWRDSTGDRFVWPLAVGIALGRVGCQLAGLQDLTYGNATTLPWGWIAGDGVPRHPVALYEALVVPLLAWRVTRTVAPGLPSRPGDRFRRFMLYYLAMRLALDCLKPPFAPAAAGMPMPDRWASLTPIQWASMAGMAYFAAGLAQSLRASVRSR